MEPGVVYVIDYRCRDLGYGVEGGTIEAFWTGAIDTWGKFTLRPITGEAPLYLFRDEILGARPVSRRKRRIIPQEATWPTV